MGGMKQLLRAFFGLRRPPIHRIALEVLHEAAEVQKMFTLMCYSCGRPDMVGVPTFDDFSRQISTGTKGA
jgi:hypothetical protein